MLIVWASTRSSVLQLPVRRACSGLIRSGPPAPGLTCSAPPSLVGLHRSGGCRHLTAVSSQSAVRCLSGVKTLSGAGTLSGVRYLSGVSGNSNSGGDAADVAGAPGVTDVAGAPGVADVAGAPGVAGAGGWYSSLSDSAPVHLCENFLVSVQQASGLPWWLSIVVATLSVRTLITLPLAAYQLVIISKVEALQVEIAELAKRLRYEVSVRARERGWTEKQSRFQFKKNLRRIVSQLYIRDNCHPFKASVLIWVQLPLWISLSLALRNLSLDQSARQAELAAGGALWFSDLTVPDSTWILPVCLGLTNLLVVEVFSLQRVTVSRFQRLVLNSIRGFSVLMIPIAATVPSSMALYWFTSSLVGFSHNLLLRSPTIHKILRLRTQRSDSPYRDLLSAFIAKYRK